MADADSVTLSEPAPPALLNLRGDPADAGFVAAVEGVLRVAPPTAPNTVAGAGETVLLWLGPDEFLAVLPRAAGADALARLRAALADRHHSLVDLSGGRIVFELAGPKAAEVLAKGVSLDLHPRVFRPGACAQTGLARVSVILHAADGGPRYRLYVRRSFAPYMRAWLVRAMAEFT